MPRTHLPKQTSTSSNRQSRMVSYRWPHALVAHVHTMARERGKPMAELVREAVLEKYPMEKEGEK